MFCDFINSLVPVNEIIMLIDTIIDKIKSIDKQINKNILTSFRFSISIYYSNSKVFIFDGENQIYLYTTKNLRLHLRS